MLFDRAWEMVAERSLSADAMFVYAVRTTGIYCRPSCPSRRPHKRAVEFFITGGEAERAGYRACKRCRPGEEHPQQRLIADACAFIDDHLEETIRLDKLGERLGMSSFHVQRLFRRTLGVTPRQYQHARRMERFRRQLEGKASVTSALYEAGFSSSSRLYENSTEQMGMTPASYREGARGVAIRYAIGESPLGKALVAVTDVGLCAVAFANLESELEDDLAARFPRAEIVRDDAGLGTTLREVLSQMTEHPTTLNLPLDIRATAFQMRVWQALREIPRGETRSYAQIAAGIGHPKAVRAVGRACGANPVAVVIPCHRAVGASGKLTGYRWGVERKEKLLAMEEG
jgi:AraC family transcriptional regulator of adaptative response/methylated-DNA-[protein]-cysteine methyltransferase